MAADAFADAIEILGIIEVLEAGNKTATKNINQAGAGRAADHVKRSLFTRLPVLVARHYAATRPGDRHARMAFELLKHQKIAKEMNAGELKKAQEKWSRCCGDHH